MTALAFDPMEFIWEKLPKMADDRVLYGANDPTYLYENGFVNTQSVTLTTWKTAFLPFKQKDGTYILSKEDFFSLRLYRDSGLVLPPFNPQKMRPGPWPDEELTVLYERSIQPSSSLTAEVYWTAINALKRQGHIDANGQLNVDDKVQQQFTYLIDKFPSPRRRLEKEVARLKKEESDLTHNAQAKREKSDFKVGKTKSESRHEDFKALENSTRTSQNATLVDPKKATIDVKKMKKPTGKFVG